VAVPGASAVESSSPNKCSSIVPLGMKFLILCQSRRGWVGCKTNCRAPQCEHEP
jgi:hypothetical protein